MLPLGLAGLLISKRWLYRLFIFWTLFSATSAINFGEKGNGSALQVWMLFGFLWLLRLILDHLSALSLSIDRRIVSPCLWLIAFLFVASLSLFMPVFIDGRLGITSPFLGENFETPLYLTSHNFTQLLYLIFGIVIAICVAHHNLRVDIRHETEKVILISAIFISLWGLFQFACNVTGIPYPYYIFNNSDSASATGFLQTLDVGISRVSSVAVEPSVLAQSLLAVLPLTLPAWLKRGSILSSSIDRLSTLLFLVVLILSTSATAYLGLFMLAALVLALLLHTRAMSIGKTIGLLVVATGTAIGAVALAMSSTTVVNDVISSALLDKSTSGSGLERIMTIGLAYGYFQKFPILGVGWGSATSHDLIVKLLSNVGILGTFIFLCAMWVILRPAWRAISPLISFENLSRSAWFLALTIFLLTSVLIEFPLVFGNFWLVVGMAAATGSKTNGVFKSVPTSEAL